MRLVLHLLASSDQRQDGIATGSIPRAVLVGHGDLLTHCGAFRTRISYIAWNSPSKTCPQCPLVTFNPYEHGLVLTRKVESRLLEELPYWLVTIKPVLQLRPVSYRHHRVRRRPLPLA